jgi:hypothetical protein
VQRELSSDQSSGMSRADAAQPGADIRCGDSADVLRLIRQPEVSLCLWQRWPDADLAGWMSQALPLSFRVECYAFVEEILRGVAVTDRLPDAPLRARLTADLQRLVDLFCELRPEGRGQMVHLKLAAVEQADCPVLHTDWVTLRMICTYVGAGTEYAAAHAVQRAALCRPLGSHAETNAAILRDPQGLRRMPPCSVGLMKGNGYPGHEGRGLVHRSPPKGGGRRIKLIIDSTLPPERHDA